MIRVARFFAALALGIGALATTSAAQATSAEFPHERHAKLFPTCLGCHAGVPAGDAATTFPAASSCASCHDGTIQKTVRWTPRAIGAVGLLKFSHPAHVAKAKDVGCADCHNASGATRMTVTKAAPERCISCHTHQASEHLAPAAQCATCHRTVATATSLTSQRIAAFPQPASHRAGRFITEHGAAAQASGATCATCHARESCARCHVDPSRTAAIAALAADARVGAVVAGKPASYPTPDSHNRADFVRRHGAASRASGATCATCHARASCEACHSSVSGPATDPARTAIDLMPVPAPGGAQGVLLKRAQPEALVRFVAAQNVGAHGLPGDSAKPQPKTVRVHAPGFRTAHGREASAGATSCAGCHAQRFCADCHTGERSSRRYHAANFLSTHAPQAYARETNCSGCHNTQTFCRDCHMQVGLAVTSSTQRTTAFHNARPLWLLQHGQAARQDLTSCTTCHAQTYCMQCHSQLGSRINPHGPGFDAQRMAARNARMCLTCHFTNPLAK